MMTGGAWIYDDVSGTMKLKIKLVNLSTNKNPEFQKSGDSGFDLMAFLPEGEERIINPMARSLIPTGLMFQIPEGYELQVRSRSGLALNHGIMVLNSPGTVDSGYRGLVGVVLYNTGDVPFSVRNGDRVAQGVICSVINKPLLMFDEVQELDSSDRGVGGYGSTGV